MGLVAENDVVEQLNPQELTGSLQILGQFLVVLTGEVLAPRPPQMR